MIISVYGYLRLSRSLFDFTLETIMVWMIWTSITDDSLACNVLNVRTDVLRAMHWVFTSMGGGGGATFRNRPSDQTVIGRKSTSRRKLKLCWAVFSGVELCWAVLSCVELCWAVFSGVELCWAVLSCVELCLVVLSCVELFLVVLSCVELCLVVLSYVELCWAVLSCVELCLVVLMHCSKTWVGSYKFPAPMEVKISMHCSKNDSFIDGATI